MFPLVFVIAYCFWLSMFLLISMLWYEVYCWIWLWAEITVMFMLLINGLNNDYWLLTIRLESWRRLAFWCQSCSGCSRIDLNRLYLSWYVVYSYCILLLGVSSRVLFWPADKGKGKADNQWAWRSRRLVHVGRWHEDLEVLHCYLFYVLSLDDLCLCRTGWTWISNFVMFWDF